MLQFGDRGGEGLDGPGAIGTLIGEENRGLEYMFIMMNAARYAVGMQGIAVAERAYQKAAAFAQERVQSRPVDGSVAGSATIIHHPDVRRMLMTMRAYTEGCRAMAIVAAAAFDAAHHHPDADVRKQNQAFYEFMVPLVKGYSTEMSIEVASLGVQVHGGMGFIEETGAAQYLRDARILTIYEGTTAIQANDLVGRKTARDGGQHRPGDRRADRGDRGRARRAATASPRASMLKRLRAAREAFEESSTSSSRESKARPERGVRRLGALPDAGRQPGGRLADGARAAGRRARARRQGDGDAPFLRGQDRDRALLRRAPAEPGAGRCATPSSTAPRASPRWPLEAF